MDELVAQAVEAVREWSWDERLDGKEELARNDWVGYEMGKNREKAGGEELGKEKDEHAKQRERVKEIKFTIIGKLREERQALEDVTDELNRLLGTVDDIIGKCAQ